MLAKGTITNSARIPPTMAPITLSSIGGAADTTPECGEAAGTSTVDMEIDALLESGDVEPSGVVAISIEVVGALLVDDGVGLGANGNEQNERLDRQHDGCSHAEKQFVSM